MSEGSRYHPVIEEALETQGVDIGRLKDKELAHRIAAETNVALRWDADAGLAHLIEAPDYFESHSEKILFELARRSINHVFDKHVSGILTRNALDPRDGMSNGYCTVLLGQEEIDIRLLQAEAVEVSRQYRDIESQAMQGVTSVFED